MASAIGSSTSINVAATTASSTTGPSTAGTEAELARYRKELADCVSCVTADTKQGKADIQELSNKIAISEARLENTTTSIPVSQPAESSPTTASNTSENSNAVVSITASKTGDESITTPTSSDSASGRFLDVFA